MIKALTLLVQGGSTIGILSPEQQQLISFIIEDVLNISLTFAICSVAFFVPFLLRAYQNKLVSERAATEWHNLSFIAKMAVETAEQTINKGDNTVKYDYANSVLEEYSKANSIKFFTSVAARVLIESCVHDLKHTTKRKIA